VKREKEKANAERMMSVEKAKVDIVTLEHRDENLDTSFKHIYENMVAGRLSAERFNKLSIECEAEQKEIKVKIVQLQELINSGKRWHSHKATPPLYINTSLPHLS